MCPLSSPDALHDRKTIVLQPQNPSTAISRPDTMQSLIHFGPVSVLFSVHRSPNLGCADITGFSSSATLVMKTVILPEDMGFGTFIFFNLQI